MLKLALSLQLLELFHRLLNWSLAIETMHIVQVNARQTETRERLLESLTGILWGTVDVAAFVLPDAIGEFRGKEDVLALAWVLFEPLA